LTRRALRDLDGIYEYIQAATSLRAAVWFDGLEKAIMALERHPRRASVAPEDKTVRNLLYGKKPHVYRILYEIDKRGQAITILHIRHGARKEVPTK
jgi:plasmid stabilization system protein ParE